MPVRKKEELRARKKAATPPQPSRADIPSPWARRYLKREHLLQVGPEAHEYLTELVHRRPRIWTVDVDSLHELLQTHGNERFRAALRCALADHRYGAEYVRHYLSETPFSQGPPARAPLMRTWSPYSSACTWPTPAASTGVRSTEPRPRVGPTATFSPS